MKLYSNNNNEEEEEEERTINLYFLIKKLELFIYKVVPIWSKLIGIWNCDYRKKKRQMLNSAFNLSIITTRK